MFLAFSVCEKCLVWLPSGCGPGGSHAYVVSCIPEVSEMDGSGLVRSSEALADALASVENRMAAHAELREKLRTVSGSATSDNRMVTVRVGEQGQITDLVFATRAYRSMAPAELSRVLLATIERARSDALVRVREAMSGLSVGGVAIDDLLAGTSRWADVVPGGAPAGGTVGAAPDGYASCQEDSSGSDMSVSVIDADARRVAAFLKRQAARDNGKAAKKGEA